MNATKIFAATAFAALAVVGAHAGEADYAQNVPSFNGERTAAEVRAEAVQKAHNINLEPAGSRVAALVNSGIDRATVRNETAIALRAGQIAHGEASMM
ncbi:MAG: DUF4148 domain-containing protein [Burkholderiaceae bacterium]|nr:MAG: DUF4148 domain-containing protein [Burkholderiaceae bacterium]